MPAWKSCFLVDWRLPVKDHIANIGITLVVFFFWQFQYFLAIWFCFGFLGLCGPKPAYCRNWGVCRGGSVAVAVGVSDRWVLTEYRWHALCDKWHMTPICDTWQVTHDTLRFTPPPPNLSVSVCFCIGAIIRKQQEIQFLPYVRILSC